MSEATGDKEESDKDMLTHGRVATLALMDSLSTLLSSGMRRPPARIACSLLALLSGVIPRAALANDDILDRLPRQPAIYLWTNDASSLIAASEELLAQPDRNSFRESIDELIDTAIANKNRQRRGRNLEMLEQLRAVWQSLDEDQLFDGQAALILPVDAVAMGDFSNFEHAPPLIFEVAFVAQSSHSKEEITAWLEGVGDLLFQAEVTADELPGHWDLEDGWFCWSETSDDTARLLDYLTGRRRPRNSVTDEREFQEVFANVKPHPGSQPQLSIYFTAESLPIVGWAMAKEIPKLRPIHWNRWQDLQLHETRGLGIQVSLGEPFDADDLNARLIADGFLLVTQPRHGVLRALANAPDTGIDLEVPTMDRPLQRFSQFHLDGQQLALGLSECRGRLGISLDRYVSANNVESDIASLRVSNIDGFAELSYEKLATDFGNHVLFQRDLSTVELVHYSNISYDSNVAELSTDDAIALRGRLRPSTLRHLPKDRVIILGESSDAYQARLTSIPQLLQQIESINQAHEVNLLRLKELGQLNQQTSQEQEALKQLQLALSEPYLTRDRIPSSIIIDGWHLKSLIHVESFQKLVADGFGQQHPQVRELQTLIDAFQRFTGQESLCGVISIWGPRMIRSVEKAEAWLQTHHQASERDVDESLGEGLRSVTTLRKFVMTINQLIVTVSSEKKGFRLHGAIIQSNALDGAGKR